MRKETRFELFLTADQSLQEKCKQEISNLFGSPVTPMCEGPSQEELVRLARFFEITLKVEAHKVWDTARELAEIDGVLEVDPEVPVKLDGTLALLVSQVEEEHAAMAAKDEDKKPDPAWFHQQTGFPRAMQYAIDEYNAQRGSYKGGETGIKIGQLDTGYTNHPEVAKVKKKEGYNYIAPPLWLRWLRPSWRRKAKDPLRHLLPFSWASHGTSTASMIVGMDTGQRNIAKGHKDRTNGVFPFVDLVPYRISNSIISFTNNLARGAAQAIRDGCKVLNVSHGTLILTRMLKEVMAESYEKGIIWVAAAGTHVARFKKIWIYPARFPETICVTASTIEGKPWALTHGGVVVDICAPGHDIYRPFAYRRWKGLLGRPGYEYGYSEGSSFSTPITAASAALWLAHHGEEKLNEYYPEPWQRVEAFRQVMKTSAVPHLNKESEKYYGVGILDVEALIKSPLPNANELRRAQPPGQRVETYTVNAKVRHMINKELAYWTGCAKVETDDQTNDELYKYVEKKRSAKAAEVLENIANNSKLVANKPGSSVKENPKSEALKVHIKHFSKDS